MAVKSDFIHCPCCRSELKIDIDEDMGIRAVDPVVRKKEPAPVDVATLSVQGEILKVLKEINDRQKNWAVMSKTEVITPA